MIVFAGTIGASFCMILFNICQQPAYLMSCRIFLYVCEINQCVQSCLFCKQLRTHNVPLQSIVLLQVQILLTTYGILIQGVVAKLFLGGFVLQNLPLLFFLCMLLRKTFPQNVYFEKIFPRLVMSYIVFHLSIRLVPMLCNTPRHIIRHSNVNLIIC